MRRNSALKLSTLIISGACLVGAATAQESSVFRYASDPFSDTATEENAVEKDEEQAKKESKEGAESSYDAYESWPSGGKDLVQRKAIFRAQQRERRIAARQWYGYSASRPPVIGSPYYPTQPLWSVPVSNQSNWGAPFGWYYPRQSLSAYRWDPFMYAAAYRR